MKISALPRKIARGLPYLRKEIFSNISDRTPFFLAVPRTVHLWRNAPCNGRCIMCDHGFLKGEALREYSHSDFTDAMIPKALDEIHDLCGRGTMVSYMGGEGTICKDLITWVEQAQRLGLDFRFTTNGYSMTEEMAQRLVAANLFNIGVSLESLDPKINETIRPITNGTAKTLRCIDLLLQERIRQKKSLSINIKTVLTDLNLESFLEIVKRYGKEDGVICTPQVFEPLEGMPQAIKDQLYIKDADRLQRVTDGIRELQKQGYAIHVNEQALHDMVKQQRDDKSGSFTMQNKKLEMDPSEPKCNVATDNLWIIDGEVKICPYHRAIGNVVTDKTTTLKQMWQDPATLKLRLQTRACRRLCTISCLRRTSLFHKISTFLKMA